jgi:hypothetical protein
MKQEYPVSERISVVIEGPVELERTEGVLLIDEVSDEALEAAVFSAGERITFTFSYNLIFCRFC